MIHATKKTTIEVLTLEDAPYLTALGKERGGRAWSKAEYQDLLRQPHIAAFGYWGTGKAHTTNGKLSELQAYILWQKINIQAEVIDLAVKKAFRQQGIAYSLLSRLESHLHGDHYESLILEVAVDNHAAISLYKKLGYQEQGRRPNYYRTTTTAAVTDALIMKKILSLAP